MAGALERGAPRGRARLARVDALLGIGDVGHPGARLLRRVDRCGHVEVVDEVPRDEGGRGGGGRELLRAGDAEVIDVILPDEGVVSGGRSV
jgi:hypothetical protein